MRNDLLHDVREANEAMPLYDECEYAIYGRAINVQQAYSKSVAVDLLRRIADELEARR